MSSEWTSGTRPGHSSGIAAGAPASRVLALLAALLVALLAFAPAARAQTPDDTVPRGPALGFFNLDRLRLGALGVQVGTTKPSRVETTTSYTVQADYGEISPRLRLVFGVSYWGSRYTRETVDAFRDTLRKVVIDPSGDDTLRLGPVTLSDVALGADLHYLPRLTWAVRPYVGGGAGLHVLNAEGKSISGTFVETALDNVNVGIDGLVGAELVAFRRVGIGAELRYDLLSGARFGSARVTGTYYFDRAVRSGVIPSRSGR